MGKAVETRILIFAKAPRPGTVKTRLIPLLGERGSAALQARLTEHTLATARAARIGPIELWCAPDCDDPFLRSCGLRYGVPLKPQSGSDLGARMLAALSHALETASRAILIGTDCPAITARHLREAERGLQEGADAIFIPAEDGGYVLIALSRCAPALFSDIEWGGADVMNETRGRLSALGWRWRELEPLWDIDRPEDYQRLLASRPMRIFPGGTGS